MNIKKRIYFMALLPAVLMRPAETEAQASASAGQTPDYTLRQRVANYLPVSPASARLIQEVDFPVDYSTGAMDVSIPLYTIRTRDFTLPLTLKATTTGIKASDFGAWTGVGWQLEAEPVITRSVRGRRDEEGYLKYNANFGSGQQWYLYEMMKGYIDEKPDVFYFRTLTNSGKFVFKRPVAQAEEGKYHPIFFPMSPERIAVPTQPSKGICLQDERGYTYQYGEGGEGTEESRQPDGSGGVTTWHATSITSPQEERITFAYTPIFQRSGLDDASAHYDFYAVEDKGDRWDNKADEAFPPPCRGYWKGTGNVLTYHRMNGYSYNTSTEEYTVDGFVWNSATGMNSYMNGLPTVFPKALSRIDFEGGHVEFVTTNDRLAQIKVYEGGLLLRTIDFTYSLYRYQDSRYKLEKVVINDKLAGKPQAYTLAYHEPVERHAPLTNNIDYWGYYNSHMENTDLVPRQRIKMAVENKGYLEGIEAWFWIGGADRSPSMYGEVYTLTAITYPHGETDRFRYELNRYKDAHTGTPKEAGGLRIQCITTHDGSNRVVRTREFAYGTDGTGVAWIPPALELYREDHLKRYIYSPINLYEHTLERRYRLFSSHPCTDLSFNGSAPVLYGSVTETVKEEGIWAVRRTEHTYSNYSKYSPTWDGTPLMFTYDMLDEWKVNYPVKERTLSLTDEAVEEKEYGHTLLTHPSPAAESTEVGDVYLYTYCVFMDDPNDRMEEYTIYRNRYTVCGDGKRVPSTTTETRRENGIPIVRKEEYGYGKTEYDVRTGQPVKVTETRPGGTLYAKETLYPYHATSEAAQRMVERNDLTRPLQERFAVRHDSVRKELKEITYHYEPSACGKLPYRLSALKEDEWGGSGTRDVEAYTRYDAHGNLTEYVRADGVTVTVLWGYNYQHPVAVVEGEAFAAVTTEAEYAALQTKTGTSLESWLQALRNRCGGRVTTYTWYSTRGLCRETNPAGVQKSYTYDGMGRLTAVHDKDGNPIEEHQYNLKQ